MMTHKVTEIFFILGLMILGLVWQMVPFPEKFACYKPDFMLLSVFFVLVFMHRRLSIFGAWMIGLVADGLHGFVLGNFAIQYAFVAMVVYIFYRRITSYSVIQQGFVLLLINVVVVGIDIGLYNVVYKQLNYCGLYSIIPNFLIWPLFYLFAGSLHKALYSK